MATVTSSRVFKCLSAAFLAMTMACTPVTMLPETQIPLRNPTAPVASQADVTLERLAGDWIVVQSSMDVAERTVTVKGAIFGFGATALPFQPIGKGRFLLGDEEIWVHWLDINNRTAVLGEPGGRRVWIMDKTGHPGERLNAAHEILEWYGYDLSRVKDLR
ncbi:lipocalin [uncultured Pelagimonas sp.]|uniref:lipocalin n=1 Tax=uncultured Pelagimonas sp. TaxID=1618102 RepID=UPI00262ABC10|nr:lipocalin [uncultured Pelagimonas sp.]